MEHMLPDPKRVELEGSVADAYSVGDDEVDWSQVDELAEIMTRVHDKEDQYGLFDFYDALADN